MSIKLIKESAEDLWYTSADGREVHAYVDFSAPETLRKPLSDMGGADFADALISAMNDFAYDMSRDSEYFRDDILDYVSGIEDSKDEAYDTLSGGVNSLRDLLNELESVLGDEDDTVNELVSRMEDKLSDLEDSLSEISGTCYDLKTCIEEWDKELEDSKY